MMKKLSILLLTILLLCGCGNASISNGKISISGYKTLKISKEASEDENKLEDAIWEALVSCTTVKKIPEKDLEDKKEQLEAEYGALSYYKGLTAEEYILEKTGKSTEELAIWKLTKKYAIELLAEKEKLAIDSERYQEMLEEAADDTDPQEYETMYGKEDLMEQFQEQEVLEFLMKYM